MRIGVLVAFFWMLSWSGFNGLYGQILSIQDCYDIAEKSNFGLRANRTEIAQREIDVKQAQYNLLPSFEAKVNQNIAAGRVLDPTTYQFKDGETSYDSDMGMSMSMELFDGLASIHKIRLNKLNVRTEELRLKKNAKELRINITTEFFKIQSLRQEMKIDSSMLGKVEDELAWLRKKAEYFSSVKPEIISMEIEQINLHSSLLSKARDLMISREALCNYLGIVNQDAVEFNDTVYAELSEIERYMSAYSLDDFIESALGNAVELAQIASEKEVISRKEKINQAALYPKVTMTGGLFSNFSNLNKDYVLNEDGQPVIRPDGSVETKDIGYGKQLMNNKRYYVGFTLSIPLFSKLSTVSTARKYRQEHIKLAMEEIDRTNSLRNTYREVYLDIIESVEQIRAHHKIADLYVDKYNFVKTNVEHGRMIPNELTTSFVDLKKAIIRLRLKEIEAACQTYLSQIYVTD